MDFSGLKKAKLKPHEKMAKMKALDDLKGVMQDLMRGDLDSMKKVTVAADSKEGLEEGLEKAKEMLPDSEEESSEMEEEGDEKEDSMMELPEDAELLAKLEERIKQKLAKLSPKE
jgi:hypothetical protein